MSEKRGSRSNDADGCCYTVRLQSSIDDIRSLLFWKAVFAEFVGTFILVMSALGSTVQSWAGDHLDIVQIALSFGISVTVSIGIIAHVSGGHINPAVTVAMLVARRVSLLRAILFIASQCVGAIAAAMALKSFTPEDERGCLGCTTLNVGVTTSMGVGVEMCITGFFVLTVFAACDSKRTDLLGSPALFIGLSISIGHLWGVEYTGAGMNPARSLGPAVAMDVWTDHWVYWVGPIAGGVIAALIYDTILASNASVRKTRDLLLSKRFDDQDYPSRTDARRVDDDGYETEAMTRTNNV